MVVIDQISLYSYSLLFHLVAVVTSFPKETASSSRTKLEEGVYFQMKKTEVIQTSPKELEVHWMSLGQQFCVLTYHWLNNSVLSWLFKYSEFQYGTMNGKRIYPRHVYIYMEEWVCLQVCGCVHCKTKLVCQFQTISLTLEIIQLTVRWDIDYVCYSQYTAITVKNY